MDFQFPSSLISFFAGVLFLLLLIKHLKKSKSGRRLPPGPWKLPFIGSLHHLAGSELPHRAVTALAKKYGPLMHLQLGEIFAIVITSPKLAKEALKTRDPAFADRMGLLSTDIMFYNKVGVVFSRYGETWRQMRKITTVEVLSNRNVRSFVSIREDEVSRLISSIRSSSGTPVNLNEKIFLMTSAITCRAAFGKTSKHQDTLIAMLKELNSLAGGFDLADLFPSLKVYHLTGVKRRLENMHKRLDVILVDLLNEHRRKLSSKKKGAKVESEEENLIDAFLRVQESGDLDFQLQDKNIKAVLWDIFTGGTETSATALEWAMSELVRHPRVMEKAQAEVRNVFKGNKKIQEVDIRELNYLKLVIKENFRLHPPLAMLLPRECREECEVGGYTIPVKTKLIINMWGIGRDPEVWEDPEKFEPERFQDSPIDYMGNHFELIPFGAGKRICPGMAFGLANLEFPLAQLLYYFDWKVPDGSDPRDLDMTEALGAAIGRKNKLHLIATPYCPPLDE